MTRRIHLREFHTSLNVRHEQCGPDDMGAEPWVPEERLDKAKAEIKRLKAKLKEMGK
jgi:hypothetical protein